MSVASYSLKYCIVLQLMGNMVLHGNIKCRLEGYIVIDFVEFESVCRRTVLQEVPLPSLGTCSDVVMKLLFLADGSVTERKTVQMVVMNG